MSKIDVVRKAMVEAMKAKDKARKDSLSMLLSALKNAEIDKREPLTEEEENAIVKKEGKTNGKNHGERNCRTRRDQQNNLLCALRNGL